LLTYLYIIQIIVAVALIAAVLLQVKGSALGGIFGGQGAVYTSRRGVEKTIFNITIGLAAAFFVFATVIVLLAG
jgi:preprotein translocase subunit SecG